MKVMPEVDLAYQEALQDVEGGLEERGICRVFRKVAFRLARRMSQRGGGQVF